MRAVTTDVAQSAVCRLLVTLVSTVKMAEPL